MKKTFTALLAFGMLAFAWHSAEHLAESHEHHGEICQIYLNGETTSDDAPESIATIRAPIAITHDTLRANPILFSKTHNKAEPRAPPTLS